MNAVSALERQVAQLQATVADLTEQVAYWKREAGHYDATITVSEIQQVFGLPPIQAWVLHQLYIAHGQFVRKEYLADNIPSRSGDDDRDPLAQSLAVRKNVHYLRQSLFADEIEGRRFIGYRLKAAGVQQVEAQLRAHGINITTAAPNDGRIARPEAFAPVFTV